VVGSPAPAHTAGAGRGDQQVLESRAGSVRIVNLVPARDLTGEREQWLVDGLVAALPGMRMADLFAQRRDMLHDADLVTVATVGGPDGELVGLLASGWGVSTIGEEFLHVTSQFVGERYRHGRVFRASWAAHFAQVCALRGDVPGLTVLKTCNPLVYCAMRAFTRLPGITMYPDITAREQDPDLVRRAVAVARSIAPSHGFAGRTGVIHGIGIPEDLYITTPLAADRRVNSYFARTTGPSDRILCLLAIPSKAAAERVLRTLGASPVFADTA
jgi:hypothetical protein